MARIIASFCVCSFLVLFTDGQSALAGTEIRFDCMQLSEIPEAEMADGRFPELESISQPPCRFLVRHLTATPSACNVNQVVDSSATSCPVEAQYGDEDRSSTIWIKAWGKLSQQRERLNSWTFQSAWRLSQLTKRAANEMINRQFSRARNVVSEIQRSIPLPSETTYPVNLPRTNTEEDISPTDQESDQYWQYYDDCDHWNVIFAMATRQSHFDAACLTSTGVALTYKHPFTQLVDGLANRNLLRTVGATNQLISEAHSGIENQLRLREFRVVESSGTRFSSRTKSIARSLQSGWESQLRAVTGVVSHVRMEHFISLRRSYPANDLRSGRDHASRYPSLR